VTDAANHLKLAEWAAGESQRLLRNEPEGRQLHTRVIGRKAACLARQLGRDGDLLIAAAYLHDIGYSCELRRTGFHPLDGALYLRNCGHNRLAGLVAHHSASQYAADLLGLTKQLRLFPWENSLLTDALTYFDMTTDLNGQEVSLGERLARVTDRYGRGHPVAQALDKAEPSLRASVRRVEQCLLLNRSWSAGLLRDSR
jgi:putative nucleotidyltransferase with HDIG domain